MNMCPNEGAKDINLSSKVPICTRLFAHGHRFFPCEDSKTFPVVFFDKLEHIGNDWLREVSVAKLVELISLVVEIFIGLSTNIALARKNQSPKGCNQQGHHVLSNPILRGVLKHEVDDDDDDVVVVVLLLLLLLHLVVIICFTNRNETIPQAV